MVRDSAIVNQRKVVNVSLGNNLWRRSAMTIRSQRVMKPVPFRANFLVLARPNRKRRNSQNAQDGGHARFGLQRAPTLTQDTLSNKCGQPLVGPPSRHSGWGSGTWQG